VAYYALLLGTETAELNKELESKLTSSFGSIEAFVASNLNLPSNESTSLECGIEVNDKSSINDLLKETHLAIEQLGLQFRFYVAAGFTTDAIFGCITNTGKKITKLTLLAPETLTFLEECIFDIYIELGEDEVDARTYAATESGDHLNDFRNFLQREFATESLTGTSDHVTNLARVLETEMYLPIDQASLSKTTIKPFVVKFMKENELL